MRAACTLGAREAPLWRRRQATDRSRAVGAHPLVLGCGRCHRRAVISTVVGMAQDKKVAAKAARDMLLAERVPVVEELAEAASQLDAAQAKEAEARAATQAAKDALRARYDDALKKGWTSDELRQLGYAPPRKRSGTSASTRRRSSGNVDSGSAGTQHAPAGADSAHAGDDGQRGGDDD